MYIRPAVIGNGAEIGVTAPAEALLFIVAVAWPDLSSSSRPGSPPRAPGLKLLASKSDVRAWPGGFGYAKVGANVSEEFNVSFNGVFRVNPERPSAKASTCILLRSITNLT